MGTTITIPATEIRTGDLVDTAYVAPFGPLVYVTVAHVENGVTIIATRPRSDYADTVYTFPAGMTVNVYGRI